MHLDGSRVCYIVASFIDEIPNMKRLHISSSTYLHKWQQLGRRTLADFKIQRCSLKLEG